MTDLTIDLYTDVSCPWCLIGQYRLDKMLAERFADACVDIVHHPVLLVPDCPPEGVRVADMLRLRHGITDPAQAWHRPQAEARLSGLEVDLAKLPFAYRTQPAHTLIRLARDRGTQHALAVALSQAYYIDLQNISDPAVLADIASRYGFEHDEAHAFATDLAELALTEREAQASREAGVGTVPHFVFGKDIMLTGGRSEDELGAAIEQGLTKLTA
ncbi:DsbA family oxidoreductase [Pseudaminobacter sp. NGMCC 1.201702]|uniref:DsbA family oxidoreductase n=1 Tax=Pseudaminobacter sp. NGMCC 1.201702 TaxID=3391825 RepID=UPI0039EFC505